VALATWDGVNVLNVKGLRESAAIQRAGSQRATETARVVSSCLIARFAGPEEGGRCFIRETRAPSVRMRQHM
jgi:hypothetical protein